jgi:uncharacterized protein YbjQ (UPF0145 family)
MSDPQRPGDVADRALQRLRERSPSRRPAAPFTCDLSVDELLLVDDAGMEPLQLVMGSCVFHVAPRYAFDETGELAHVTRAMYQARRRAMGRMREEAARLAADGVVGVRIGLDFERWGEDLCEFTAVGTAVRGRSGRLRTRGSSFTSHLSGQDFSALLRAGYRPIAMVMGAAVWRVARQSIPAWLASRGRNVELTSLTEALSTARERAMARMGSEARTARAEGVVGVSVEQHGHAWGSHTIEFLALGTAVRPLPGAQPPPTPSLVVPVDAPTVRAAGITVDTHPPGARGAGPPSGTPLWSGTLGAPWRIPSGLQAASRGRGKIDSHALIGALACRPVATCP